jgi:hypothetical protein
MEALKDEEKTQERRRVNIPYKKSIRGKGKNIRV